MRREALNLQKSFLSQLEDENDIIQLEPNEQEDNFDFEEKNVMLDVDLDTIDEFDIDWESNDSLLDITTEDKESLNVLFKDLIVVGSGSGGGGESCKCAPQVYVINQEDTQDVETAASKIKKLIDDTIMIIRNEEGQSVGYAYKDGVWTAFTGNVSAANVYFDNDITCAGSYTQVGNVTKTASEVTKIPAKGKSVEDVMRAIFTKELQPSATQPSAVITLTGAGSYEVGTTFTPKYTTNFNAGSYTYGPATGVTVTGWYIEDSLGHTATTTTGSFMPFVVNDTTNYKITAKASHTAGAIAVTNMGSPSNPTIQILAGDKTSNSSSVTGYRSFFYGVVNDTVAMDSAKVRALTNGKKASAQKVTVKVNGNTNAKRIIVAIPTKSGLKVKTVSKTDGLVTDITSTYSKTGTVQVDGANNVGDMVSYDIWTYQPAAIDSGEIHEITIG